MKFIKIALISALHCSLAIASEKDHDSLRKLKNTAIDLINAKQFEKLSPLIHSNVVITAENHTVVRGEEKLQEFYKNMLLNQNAPLVEFKIRKFDVDELSILYQDSTAIAFGNTESYLKLKDGNENVLQTRWTATLIKEQSQWKLAAFHNSVDFTNNPLMDATVKWSIFGMIGTFIVGLGLGAYAHSLKRR